MGEEERPTVENNGFPPLGSVHGIRSSMYGMYVCVATASKVCTVIAAEALKVNVAGEKRRNMQQYGGGGQ